MRIVKIVRRVMARRGDAKLPVWVTELSWPAAQGKTVQHGGFETTESGQARRLDEGLPLLADERRTLRIERVYWYTWLSAEGHHRQRASTSPGCGGCATDSCTTPRRSRCSRGWRAGLQGCAKRSGDARRCR